MKVYISIDVGGTSIKSGILTEDGRILNRKEQPTEAWKGGPAVLETVSGMIANAMTVKMDADIGGVCISSTGVVDPVKGEILYAAPFFPQYAGVNYKNMVQTKFQLPCEIENDVNCAGLAEYHSGAGQGSHNMVMLTIGTGIGGCLILDGNLVRGSHNCACEIGYMHLRDSHFQTLGSASALSAKVASWKHEQSEDWSGRRIFAAACQGDIVCRQAISELASVLGMGISNLCYILDPEVVVLGGGIMAQEKYLRPLLEVSVREACRDTLPFRARLAFARYQNDAGLLGAFCHFRQRQGLL